MPFGHSRKLLFHNSRLFLYIFYEALWFCFKGLKPAATLLRRVPFTTDLRGWFYVIASTTKCAAWPLKKTVHIYDRLTARAFNVQTLLRIFTTPNFITSNFWIKNRQISQSLMVMRNKGSHLCSQALSIEKYQRPARNDWHHGIGKKNYFLSRDSNPAFSDRWQPLNLLNRNHYHHAPWTNPIKKIFA